MKFIYAVSILTGTMVGASLFALPHITTQVGIELMLVYFSVIGLVSVSIHTFFSDLALKTRDNIRLPGFAETHLGSWAKNITIFTGIIGLSGSVLAYIILGGEFLSGLFGDHFGGGAFEYSILYWFLGAVFIYFGIKAIEKVELVGIVGFLFVLFLILIRGRTVIDPSIFTNIDGGASLFLPYGAVLFSLWGAALIPEIEEVLVEKKEKLKWVGPVSVCLAILIYLFFIFIVVGITGIETSEEAIFGLVDYLENGIIGLALVFGLLATFTSFVTLGLTLKKILWFDLGLCEKKAWGIVAFTPLIFFIFGLNNYIAVISFVGAMVLAVDAILITIMYQKYKPARYKFLTYPVITIFALGIIYNIIHNSHLIHNLFS